MPKLVKNFNPTGGRHCITTALKQIFDYNGLNLSEEMIFGLGSGLSFCYINLQKSPMISGRTKPMEFEGVLGERLGVDIRCRSSKEYSSAFKKTIKLLDGDKPVLAYTDMAYLDYMNLDEDSHFGGHAVVIYGYDEDNNNFYISDRDSNDNPIRTPKGAISSDYHLVGYDQLERARSSKHRPFPANNKYLDISIDGTFELTEDMIQDSIGLTCDSMLNPPAKLLGINGIKKFSREIMKWKSYDDSKLSLAGITNYFQISADGGTGGGIFRRMYGDFLIQAGSILGVDALNVLGSEYLLISEEWDMVAKELWSISQTLDRDRLKDISIMIDNIHNKELNVLTKLEKHQEK